MQVVFKRNHYQLFLSISFEGQAREYYKEATLHITEIKEEDLQSNFTCVVMNEMGNTRATVTLQLKAQCKGRICSFCFLTYLRFNLKYIGDFIFIFNLFCMFIFKFDLFSAGKKVWWLQLKPVFVLPTSSNQWPSSCGFFRLWKALV